MTRTTTCCYCGVGCGVIAHRDKNGALTVQGDPDHPVNRGQLCSKGMNLHHTVNDRSDRLLYPQMRFGKKGPLQRVTWDTALERSAAVFRTLIDKYGPDSVAIYASGQCLTEEYYTLNKLMKGFIGSNNIDTNSRLCMSSAVVAYKMALGEDSVPGCYEDVDETDCIYVDGANPAWCHPILWRRVEVRKAANPDLMLIVADPRRTDTAMMADIHLQLLPGTDITLNHAIARLLIENGDIDIDFIREHTEGFEAYSARVFRRTLAEAADICGVDAGVIRRAARSIAGSRRLVTMWTMGLNQSVAGVHKNLSLISLNLITGRIGRPGCGPFSLTGQPNAMGGREVGGLATLLAAHRDLSNPVHRAEVAAYWGGGPIASKPGLTATQMFEALEDGRLKAIWIIGTNPLVSLPDVRRAERALAAAKFVIVQEVSRKPETLAYADVVLPAAAWAEKEGTMTNSERRISRLHKVVDAPGEALPDWEIICRIARRMGFSGFEFKSPSEIYDEHVGLTRGTRIDISGVNYERLSAEGTVQWPCPGSEGTPRLFTNHRFYTPSARARLYDLPDELYGETPDGDFPFILTTGRIRDQWHTMTKTGKVRRLGQHIPQPFVEVHPDDAAALGIAADDLVRVSSRRGDVRVRARISDSIRRGVLFLPMHWGKILQNDLQRANNVTHNLVDPLSGEPDFKFCAVAAEKYIKPRQRIVIVGAGAGAYAFIRAHDDDDITVFSKESHPFYNRILLPGYVSGEHDWDRLENPVQADGVTVHRGVAVTAIDRERRTVTDTRGRVTPYDVLILATGSRAVWPRQVPALEGLFTLRTREDGDRFRAWLSPGARVVIAGGGLIGLEMAASLRKIGVTVTIVHRSSRFMDRQLDALGSELLREQVAEMGCDIYFNDEVQLFYGDKRVTGIRLKSGRYIDCDAVMFGIGTQPNIELARDGGLACQRGVIVDECMRTSDPFIYAIGEIAECKGALHGIAAAAEEQAGVLASHLQGDPGAVYTGTLGMNVLKIPGFDLCSMGMTTRPDDPAYEEIIFIDRARRYYKKCIVHMDRLVGAILIGDKQEMQEFRDLIAQGLELSEKRLQLLRSGRQTEPVLGKLVCSCLNVGAGNIRAAAGKGSCTVAEVGAATGAGTGCGSCKPEIQRILEGLVAVTV